MSESSELLLEVKLTDPSGIAPIRPSVHTTIASALTLFSPVNHVVAAGVIIRIPLFVALRFPEGYHGMLVPAYELTSREIYTSVQTVQNGQNLEIIMENRGELQANVDRHDAVAELILLPLITPEPVIVDYLGATQNPSWNHTGADHFTEEQEDQKLLNECLPNLDSLKRELNSKILGTTQTSPHVLEIDLTEESDNEEEEVQTLETTPLGSPTSSPEEDLWAGLGCS